MAKAKSKKKALATGIPTVTYGSVKIKNPHNAPQLTEVAQSIHALNEIVGDLGDHKYSPFGHKLGSDNGKIDVLLLKGVTTLSALAAVCGTSRTSKKTKVSERAKNKRPRDHIVWEANTAGKGGYGLDSRLKNVTSEPSKIGKACAPHLKVIADYIAGCYTAMYGKNATR